MLNLIRKSGELLKGKKLKVFALFIMMVISAILETLGVTLIVPIVSMIMDAEFYDKKVFMINIYKFLSFKNQKDFVVCCIIALIFVFILKNVFLIFRYSFQFKFVYAERVRTQCKLLNGYFQQPYYYFMNIDTAEIMRVLGIDVNSTYQVLVILLTLFSELIVSAALIAVVFIISPIITIAVALLLLITLFVIIKIVRPYLRKAGKKRKTYITRTHKILLQAFEGIKEIKITGTEKAFYAKYSNSCQKLSSAERKNAILEMIPMTLLEMSGICAGLSVLVIFVYIEIDSNILIPQLSAFALAAVRLLPSLNRIASAINSITYLEPSLDVVLTLLNEYKNCDSLEELEDIIDVNVRELKKIRLENVTFKYPGRNNFVFKQANISIPIGKSIGIVGASGAGKTTIVDVLMGLLPLNDGSVLVDNRIIDSNECFWRKNVGYIPQNLFMLDDTIRENIIFGRKKQLEDRQVWEVLKKANISEFVKALPLGLDTVIGERGIRLSGGQRQRIAVARALFMDPDIIVMDEATSALDNETERAIMESINALKEKKTLIIIAHRLTTIEQCDVLYRVQDGKLLCERGKELV